MSRENPFWCFALIRQVHGACFCFRKFVCSSYTQVVRDVLKLIFVYAQSIIRETDQNEKSIKLCKTTSFQFPIGLVYWLYPWVTFCPVAVLLALYEQIRDVPNGRKFEILYSKMILLLQKNDLKLVWVVIFFGAAWCFIHMGIGPWEHIVLIGGLIHFREKWHFIGFF